MQRKCKNDMVVRLTFYKPLDQKYKKLRGKIVYFFNFSAFAMFANYYEKVWSLD